MPLGRQTPLPRRLRTLPQAASRPDEYEAPRPRLTCRRPRPGFVRSMAFRPPAYRKRQTALRRYFPVSNPASLFFFW